MALADVLSGLPRWLRGTLFLVTIPLGLYFGIVVTPVAVSAIQQGRSIKLGPIEIGAYEESNVKQCKLVLQDTNENLRILQEQIKALVDLKKSQNADILNQITERTKFLQITQEDQNKLFYTPQSVLDTLNNTILQLDSQAVVTSNKLIESINSDVNFVNQVRTYCLNFAKKAADILFILLVRVVLSDIVQLLCRLLGSGLISAARR